MWVAKGRAKGRDKPEKKRGRKKCIKERGAEEGGLVMRGTSGERQGKETEEREEGIYRGEKEPTKLGKRRRGG